MIAGWSNLVSLMVCYLLWLGGIFLCAPKQLRHFHDAEDLQSDKWALQDEEVASLDQERAAEPAELEDAPIDRMTKREMEKDAYYNVQAILNSKHGEGLRFLTLREACGIEENSRETIPALIQPDGTINKLLPKYLTKNAMGSVLHPAGIRASSKRST